MSSQRLIKMSEEQAEKVLQEIEQVLTHPFTTTGRVHANKEGTEDEYYTIGIFIETTYGSECIISISCPDDWEAIKLFSSIVIENLAHFQAREEMIKALSVENSLHIMVGGRIKHD